MSGVQALLREAAGDATQGQSTILRQKKTGEGQNLEHDISLIRQKMHNKTWLKCWYKKRDFETRWKWIFLLI